MGYRGHHNLDDLEHLASQHRLQQLQQQKHSSIATSFAYAICALYVIHQLLAYFDVPVLAPQEILWNAVVFIIPTRILLDRARREELKTDATMAQTHAAKSEALRRMCGLGLQSGTGLMQKLPGEGIMRRASGFVRLKPTTDAPPGLGNWDNSCYQNSVLQGLASLDSLKPFLREIQEDSGSIDSSTGESLSELIAKLNDAENNGKQLWTPAKLKSMSSWQQQDAQEYFSKIMDELDKEAARSLTAGKSRSGLEGILENMEARSGKTETVEEVATGFGSEEANEIRTPSSRNPLEGLLAQRVVCTSCNFSEGLSMIPFNCLTVPLGSRASYGISECLDEYTKLEEINEVECAKCTLMKWERQLENMLPSVPSIQQDSATSMTDSKMLELPAEVRAQAFQRLAAIKRALDEDDLSDKTLNEACQIPKKGRVSSTKTRQAVIGRAPQSLVVHVNRSVFDEMTGMQRKNYANVHYPMVLDLERWMLNQAAEGNVEKGGVGGGGDAQRSMLARSRSCPSSPGCRYRLKAVVTHYGRHENGHYIAYRKHPLLARPEHPVQEDDSQDGESGAENLSKKREGECWWRLSDEDVSAVSEEDVLVQGGVFMLFYELESDIEGSFEQTVPTVTEIQPSENDRDISTLSPESETLITATTSPAMDNSAIPSLKLSPTIPPAQIFSEPPPESTSTLDSHPPSSPSTTNTNDDSEPGHNIAASPHFRQIASQPPPFMRTSRGQRTSRGSHGQPLRPVAAT